MTGILFDASSNSIKFVSTNLDTALNQSEKWLQKTLFDHPDILPVEELDPAAREFLPICRELALTGARGSVFLDIFGVGRSGKLVLIECKLWRNPEARREVIAQILEYASILCQRTYSDLEARLKASLGWTGTNPLYHQARKKWPDLSERVFVEGVERSLAQADFTLIIAGDGIRSDAQAIARMLEQRGGLAARVGLVEVKTWSGPNGELFVNAAVSVRTDVATTRVLMSSDNRPLLLVSAEETETPEAAFPTEQSTAQIAKRKLNREFWERFAAAVKFDHPDQDPLARMGVNNFVWFPFVGSVKRLTVYRSESTGRMGLFFRLSGRAATHVFDGLKADAADLDAEIGTKVNFGDPQESDGGEVSYTVGVDRQIDVADQTTVPEHLAWLTLTANSFVTAFRPRLARLLREADYE